MIKFGEYFSLQEDPDQLYINNDNLKVDVEYDFDDNTIYGFGFLNTNIEFMGVKPFAEMQSLHSELAVGRGLSHGLIKRLFFEKIKTGIVNTYNNDNKLVKFDLSDLAQHQEFMKSPLMKQINARLMFSPSGRIWTNIKNNVDNKSVAVLSFWAFKDKQKNKDNDPSAFGDNKIILAEGYEVTATHIKRILNKVGIPRDQWNDVYLEFLEDEYAGALHKRLTFREFLGNTNTEPAINKTKEDVDKEQEMIKSGQERIKLGAHGNKLNTNFGSPVQLQKAKKSGIPSYAEYHAKRNPQSESIENY